VPSPPKLRALPSPVLMTQPDDPPEPDSQYVPGEAATQLGLQPPLEIVDTIWRLVVTSEPGAGKSYPLQGQVRVGRDSDNDITLPDDKRASRHHALFQITDNTLHIFDLNSSNGVYVDDKRIRGSSRLRSGNLVKIGKTTFVVQYDG